MNLPDLLLENEINEELRFFKKSEKLSNYADKIENKLSKFIKSKNIEPEKASLINDFIKKIRDASKEFSDVETSFKNKSISRKEAKEKLDKLKEKYSALMRDLKKETLKKALRIIGVGAVLASIVALIATFGIKTTITGGALKSGAYSFPLNKT